MCKMIKQYFFYSTKPERRLTPPPPTFEDTKKGLRLSSTTWEMDNDMKDLQLALTLFDCV